METEGGEETGTRRTKKGVAQVREADWGERRLRRLGAYPVRVTRWLAEREELDFVIRDFGRFGIECAVRVRQSVVGVQHAVWREWLTDDYLELIPEKTDGGALKGLIAETFPERPELHEATVERTA